MLQGQRDKVLGLEQLLSCNNLRAEEVAYIGDDLPDYAVIQAVGLAACPNNAVDEIARVCHFQSRFNGGEGAVRELCEALLKAQGRWEQTIEKMFLHPDPTAKHHY